MRMNRGGSECQRYLSTMDIMPRRGRIRAPCNAAGRCPRSAHGIRRCGLDGAAPYGLHIKAGYPGRARRRSHCARAIARAACKPSSARGHPMATRPLYVTCARNTACRCVLSMPILMTNRAISRLRLARCAMPRHGDMFANFVPNRAHRGRRLVSVPRILRRTRGNIFDERH